MSSERPIHKLAYPIEEAMKASEEVVRDLVKTAPVGTHVHIGRIIEKQMTEYLRRIVSQQTAQANIEDADVAGIVRELVSDVEGLEKTIAETRKALDATGPLLGSKACRANAWLENRAVRLGVS